MSNNLQIKIKKSQKAICVGTGLVALDVIMNGNPNSQPKLLAGGSCGNVLSILSFLGWTSFPIARFEDNQAAQVLNEDLTNNNVRLDFISQTKDGSTPIIIHRILKDNNGDTKHRFEFKVPHTGKWFPSYKSVRRDKVVELLAKIPVPKVFYFDRISRGNIDLAIHYKNKGALIFFEPSSASDEKMFKECLLVTDILKFSNDRLKGYKEQFRYRQVPLEIETLGKEGINYRSFINKKTDDWKTLNAPKIDKVTDSAGAGDWCSAAIIHLLGDFGGDLLSTLTVTEIEEALKLGQILGAINCTYFGARGLMYNCNIKAINKIIRIYAETKLIETLHTNEIFEIGKEPFDFSVLS